ncbi:MAG: hypothetical protein WBD99_14165 [Thermodesulfobacteriota bacterium]
MYQDKEDKKLNDGSPIKTFEDDGRVKFRAIYYFLDFVDEISDIYSDDNSGSVIAKGEALWQSPSLLAEPYQ